MSDTVKLAIDAQFWFERSAEMVKDSSSRLDKWADRVRDMIVWAFGLYTAGSILTVEFKKIDELWILLLLALPYFLIIIVYWQSQAAQVPIDLSFHEASPSQIKGAYQSAYAIKTARVNRLIRSSFFALFSVATALITALVIKNEQRSDKPQPPANYFDGKVVRNEKATELVVTGQFPADSLLSIRTTSYSKDEKLKKIISKEDTFSILNHRNGILQHTFVTDTSIHAIYYQVDWNQGSYRKSLGREFRIKPIVN